MIDHELTDPAGGALTITHDHPGVWVTATEGREEVTVGPFPARTLRASFDMGDDLLDGGVTAAAIEAEVVSPERARSLVQERDEAVTRVEKAEARIQAVRDVHRRYGVYELEDSCTIAGDQHREEHHHECSDDAGEYYCDLLPIGAQCDECRDSYGDRVDWPCPTTRALDGDAWTAMPGEASSR